MTVGKTDILTKSGPRLRPVFVDDKFGLCRECHAHADLNIQEAVLDVEDVVKRPPKVKALFLPERWNYEIASTPASPFVDGRAHLKEILEHGSLWNRRGRSKASAKLYVL